MEDAELYAVHNSLQRQGTVAAMRVHWPRMQWDEGEGERALDVGCGPGDVTCELLLPALPSQSTLVGIDVSAKMVEYASSKYKMQNVHFKTVDFSMKNITSVLQPQSFTKIFSFYCLHWIRDQQQVGRNVFSLLRPGGEFLFVVAPSSQIYRVYRALAQMDQWKPYMHDVDRYVPCLNSSEDACGETRRLLEEAGLQVTACDVNADTVTFPTMRTLMRANEAVNPFLHRMSESVREQYMTCFERICIEQRLLEQTAAGQVTTCNHNIVVCGRKPQTTD